MLLAHDTHASRASLISSKTVVSVRGLLLHFRCEYCLALTLKTNIGRVARHTGSILRAESAVLALTTHGSRSPLAHTECLVVAETWLELIA